MEVLDNLNYTENHEWILLDSGIATIGVTDYAQKELGDIVYVDVDTLGETLNADDIFGSIEAVKTVSDLFMPISGEVISINPKLETNPDLVNDIGAHWSPVTQTTEADFLVFEELVRVDR